MSKSSLFSLLSVAALSLGLTISAGATTVTVGGSAPAGSVATTFGVGNTAVGGSWSFGSLTGTADMNLTNQYVDPLSTTDYFAYAKSGGTITATFAPITSFSLFWGSPDDTNSVTLGGMTYTGASIPLVTSGTNTNSTEVTFTADPGTYFTTVSFFSATNSFEFGNVATIAAPAPEPASIALIAGGLIAIGAGAFRRRKL